MHFRDLIQNPRRKSALQVRAKVEHSVKEFFFGQGFTETRTPLLVRSPGMEPHLKPFQLTNGAFLPTSPEFAMKKLLVGGLEKIFQICPAFRDEPISNLHLPEFTILEWYRANDHLESIMRDCENLVEHISVAVLGVPYVNFQGKKILVQTPWPKFTVNDLFRSEVGIDLREVGEVRSLAAQAKKLGVQANSHDSWDDIFFKIWLDHVEPKLPQDRAVFVTHYPASQCALAVVENDHLGHPWALRFEPYIGGIEIGNAFEELTDPSEQEGRFIEDIRLRNALHSDFPKSPIDDEFIEALNEGLPPSGGIAVGVDRLVMLFADEPDIRYTTWLPSFTTSI